MVSVSSRKIVWKPTFKYIYSFSGLSSQELSKVSKQLQSVLQSVSSLSPFYLNTTLNVVLCIILDLLILIYFNCYHFYSLQVVPKTKSFSSRWISASQSLGSHSVSSTYFVNSLSTKFSLRVCLIFVIFFMQYYCLTIF